MDTKKVLFVCVHNSARSQMAEAFLNKMAGDRFKAESAGLETIGRRKIFPIEFLTDLRKYGSHDESLVSSASTPNPAQLRMMTPMFSAFMIPSTASNNGGWSTASSRVSTDCGFGIFPNAMTHL